MSNHYALLMAGGVGERFKPLSTPEYPKQFHDLLGKGKSLLQLTYDRFNSFTDTDHIFIATNKRYASIVRSQLHDTSTENLILETFKRNTAPCILFAALKLYQKDPDAIMIVSPTDHRIENSTGFAEDLLQAIEFCSSNDALLTFGITPDLPRTEYGYINFEPSGKPIKKVLRFVEKPTITKAQAFLENGQYLWNSGLFIWSVRSILKAFTVYQPQMVDLFKTTSNLWNSEEERHFMNNQYPNAENVSVDFGIMEKADNVFVLPASFDWSDIGSWKSLYDILPKDHKGVARVKDYEIEVDQKQNITVSSKGKIVLQLK